MADTLPLTRTPASPEVAEAIRAADLVVIGPGDLFTSIIPNLLVSGISDAINKSKAEVVFVMNLMTKYGQTTGFTASDHLADLEKYINHSVDTVIVNTEKPDDESLSWYEISHEAVVEAMKKAGVRVRERKAVKISKEQQPQQPKKVQKRSNKKNA